MHEQSSLDSDDDAGWRRQRDVGSALLADSLTAYFGVPVTLDSVPELWPCQPRRQVAPRAADATLGDDAMPHETSGAPDLRVRIRIGPLSRVVYTAFLPGGESTLALRQFLSRFGQPTIHYEVVLVLAAAEIPPLQLPLPGSHGPRLGFDAFLVTEPQTCDRSEVRYDVAGTPPLTVRESPT